MRTMVQIEIDSEIIEELREVLNELENVYHEHHSRGCCDSEIIVDPWTPSGAEDQGEIYLPEFTVGVAKKAVNLKRRLKL